LDTTVIVDYLWYKSKSQPQDETIAKRVSFVGKLIDFLVREAERHNRKFYYSAVTIAELRLIKNPYGLQNKIIEALQTEDLALVNFTRDVALTLNSKLDHLLTKKELSVVAQTLEPGFHDMKLYRDVIFKDYMIIASSLFVKADIILTADSKRFVEACNKAGAFVALTEEENFNVSQSGNNIFGLK